MISEPSVCAGVRGVMSLSDPLGVPSIHRELDRGLVLKRLTVPLGNHCRHIIIVMCSQCLCEYGGTGVLGIIFEARPEALI